MGEAYNAAAQQDYQQIWVSGTVGHASTGITRSKQQAQAARRAGVPEPASVLGVVGDMVQLAISGTTGFGPPWRGLLNTATALTRTTAR